jgi:hypothetical protein
MMNRSGGSCRPGTPRYDSDKIAAMEREICGQAISEPEPSLMFTREEIDQAKAAHDARRGKRP